MGKTSKAPGPDGGPAPDYVMSLCSPKGRALLGLSVVLVAIGVQQLGLVFRDFREPPATAPSQEDNVWLLRQKLADQHRQQVRLDAARAARAEHAEKQREQQIGSVGEVKPPLRVSGRSAVTGPAGRMGTHTHTHTHTHTL